jgi:N-acetylmuramoyl-L-alanine amidase
MNAGLTRQLIRKVRVRESITGLILLIASLNVFAAQVDVSNPRIWPAPDNTRLVFDLSDMVVHRVFSLQNPERLVVDIEDSQLKSGVESLPLAGSPVNSIRSARRNGNDLRIVLDLKRKLTARTFVLKPNEQYGTRLVIDLLEEEAKEEPVIHKSVDDKKDKRDVVIVIDAGHGGDDPGAIGPGKVREKDIVLAIARELQAEMNGTPGYRVKLTRTADYYVGLRQRTKLARKYNADLLVSVHADAFNNPAASGASVFALSKRGATSESARWLVASENRADLIGGVGGVSLDDKDDVLAGVLLDLSMTASMKASLGVGDHVLQSLGTVGRLHKRRVEQAGFVVLKSPDIPSILVETGFISNPVEAQRLNTRKYQRNIALAIKTGLTKHFEDAPPVGTWLAWRRDGNEAEAAQTYIIRKGDTLTSIARQNRVTVSQLIESNGLKNESLRVGQVIAIPTS